MQRENFIEKNANITPNLICDATTKSHDPTYYSKEYINNSKIVITIVSFNVLIKVFVIREYIWEKNQI